MHRRAMCCPKYLQLLQMAVFWASYTQLLVPAPWPVRLPRLWLDVPPES
jgi:hypothetical protein